MESTFSGYLQPFPPWTHTHVPKQLNKIRVRIAHCSPEKPTLESSVRLTQTGSSLSTCRNGRAQRWPHHLRISYRMGDRQGRKWLLQIPPTMGLILAPLRSNHKITPRPRRPSLKCCLRERSSNQGTTFPHYRVLPAQLERPPESSDSGVLLLQYSDCCWN